MSEVFGSASAVLSTKRTAEVIPERLAVAEEKKWQRFAGSDFGRRKGSPLTLASQEAKNNQVLDALNTTLRLLTAMTPAQPTATTKL
jgi:hypothetical protein